MTPLLDRLAAGRSLGADEISVGGTAVIEGTPAIFGGLFFSPLLGPTPRGLFGMAVDEAGSGTAFSLSAVVDAADAAELGGAVEDCSEFVCSGGGRRDGKRTEIRAEFEAGASRTHQ